MDLLKKLAQILQQQQQQQAQATQGTQGTQGGQEANAGGQDMQKALTDLIEEAKRNPKGLAGALQQNPQMNQVLSNAIASANLSGGAGGVRAT